MTEHVIQLLAAGLWMCLWVGGVFVLVLLGAFITDVIAERLYGRPVIAKEKRPDRSRGA